MRKENRSESIQNALQYLDDEMIEEVANIRREKVANTHKNRSKTDIEHCSEMENEELSLNRGTVRRRKFKNSVLATAASITLFLIVGWAWNNVVAPSMDRYTQEEGIEETPLKEGEAEAIEKGITLPALQPDLEKPEGNWAGDIIGLFIYQGRCYVQTKDYFEKNLDFLGEKLGTATGLLDEWSKKDGYVELAGTVSGDFYEVKGVEPEFMLAIMHEYEDVHTVELYVNNNGITLYKGADIIDKYLHVKENYTEVSFLTDAQLEEAWSVGASVDMKTKKLSRKQYDLIDQFIDAYSEGQFVKANFNGGDDNNDHVYHLYFTLDSGVRLHFILAEDGYVYFEGLYGVCVKVDMDIYDDLIQVLKGAS